jgi:hypothetical protein
MIDIKGRGKVHPLVIANRVKKVFPDEWKELSVKITMDKFLSICERAEHWNQLPYIANKRADEYLDGYILTAFKKQFPYGFQYIKSLISHGEL